MAEIRFKQICVGQYTGAGRESRQSFIVIGLSDEGNVYQFKSGKWQRIEELFQTPQSESSTGQHTIRFRDKQDEAPW